MKRVVTSGDLSQRAMRPADLLQTYLGHVQDDIARFELLKDGSERDCPACGGQGTREFERFGFTYQRCAGCGSLFVSPLPDVKRIARYHAEGAAERFRREQWLPQTADVRARHNLGPRARWVIAEAAARLPAGPMLAQFGPEFPPLLDLLRPSARVVPWADGSDAELDGVIAFDIVERVPEFSQALSRCRRAVRGGGLLFVATTSGDGFEVRMLGARMTSLAPPVHLQLLSRAGWVAALAREDFTIVEYSTPGELDVQAVAEVCRQDPEVRLPPILGELVRHEDEEVGRLFQELLQHACLSAHVQLVAQAGKDR